MLHNRPCHLPVPARERAVFLLNKQLADAIDLHLHAKRAQWNMSDPHFTSLQLLCHQVSREIGDVADEIADRIARLGGKTCGTAFSTASDSRLPIYPLEMLSNREHLTALCNSLSAFAAFASAAAENAGNDDDLDTAEVLVEVARTSDKLLRIIKSYFGRQRPERVA